MTSKLVARWGITGHNISNKSKCMQVRAFKRQYVCQEINEDEA